MGWKKTPWLGLTNGDVVVVLLVVVVGLKMNVRIMHVYIFAKSKSFRMRYCMTPTSRGIKKIGQS